MNLRVLFVVGALAVGFVGFGVALALLPDRVHDLGYSDLALGLVAGLFPVMAISGRLASGWMIDRVGSRMSMAIGLSVTAAGAAAFALPGLAGVFVARGLQGLGDGLLYTSAAAAALDLVADDRRGQALGWMSAGLWSGLSLGTAIGALFDSLQVAGLIFGGIGALALLFVPSLPPGRTDRVETSESLFNRLIAREALRPGSVVGLTNLGYAAITGFAVVLFADRFDHGNYVLTAFGVTLLIVRGGFGFLVDRLPPARGIDIAHVTLVAGIIILAVSPSLPIAIVGAMVCAVGHSLPYPILVTVVLDRSGPERRGAILGTMIASFDIIVAIALFVFGVVSDLFGTVVVYIVAACGIVAGNLISRTLGLPSSTRSHPSTTPEAVG